MNWLRSRIARNPRLALVVGKTVFLVGSIMVVAAVFGRAGIANMNGDRAAAKLPALHTLAEAFPQYPTILVPEGPVGFIVAAVLVLVGMGLIVLAEKASKKR